MEEKSYKDFMSNENINRIRNRVIGIMREKCMTINAVSKELMITPATAARFIQETGDCSFLTLLKFDEYIRSFERIL